MPVPDLPAVTFPDVELIVTAYLRTQLGTVPVVSILPATVVAPVVRVRRTGGAWKFGKRLDEARLDVDCWATSPVALNTLIASVRTALEASAGHAAEGGLITYSTELSGPAWRPEKNPELYRKGLTHQLLIRPT